MLRLFLSASLLDILVARVEGATTGEIGLLPLLIVMVFSPLGSFFREESAVEGER